LDKSALESLPSSLTSLILDNVPKIEVDDALLAQVQREEGGGQGGGQKWFDESHFAELRLRRSVPLFLFGSWEALFHSWHTSRCAAPWHPKRSRPSASSLRRRGAVSDEQMPIRSRCRRALQQRGLPQLRRIPGQKGGAAAALLAAEACSVVAVVAVAAAVGTTKTRIRRMSQMTTTRSKKTMTMTRMETRWLQDLTTAVTTTTTMRTARMQRRLLERLPPSQQAAPLEPPL
jgi:hypothetical protein